MEVWTAMTRNSLARSTNLTKNRGYCGSRQGLRSQILIYIPPLPGRGGLRCKETLERGQGNNLAGGIPITVKLRSYLRSGRPCDNEGMHNPSSVHNTLKLYSSSNMGSCTGATSRLTLADNDNTVSISDNTREVSDLNELKLAVRACSPLEYGVQCYKRLLALIKLRLHGAQRQSKQPSC